jgi:glycosyltransferase involved in cell wall biosynthesis
MAELRRVASGVDRRLRVLFFVEGYTDIRFVVGLSEICDLTMAVPARAFDESGLKARVAASGARLKVHEIAGGRASFQLRSLAYLWKAVPEVEVVLAQELMRGSLNATVVGALRRVPVVTTMSLPPVEYFRCRRERGRIGVLTAWAGEAVIRTLMTVNGRLATRCLALGPYLQDIARQYCAGTEHGYYYGVDVSTFHPAASSEREAIRRRLALPVNAFLIVLASRISHEKDPETVLQAVAAARARGLNAVLLNLSGGYEEFLAVARSLDLADSSAWVLARPAVHPMTELADYMRAADALVQGSLEEGLGLSPLEALACEVPVVATNVGGMAAHLGNYATLTPRRDAGAMADALITIAARADAAREQARRGRDYVCREWSRTKAFAELKRSLVNASLAAASDAPHRAAA